MPQSAPNSSRIPSDHGAGASHPPAPRLLPEAEPAAGDPAAVVPGHEILPGRRAQSHRSLFSLRPWQGVAARLFPHQAPSLVCPPGPIPTGPQPPIIVSSLMRSGTHLAMDLLLNNLPGYRQDPLYIDFDAYVYEGFSSQALLGAGSTIIKTHIAQRPFSAPSLNVLKEIGSRGLVIIPVREPLRIQSSMARWGYQITESYLTSLHQQQLEFWKDHQPILIHFKALLQPGTAAAFLTEVRQRLGLPPPPAGQAPVTAGSSRPRNLWRKLRTRLQASKAPIINSTLGFRL